MKFKVEKFLSYYKPYLSLFIKILICAIIIESTTLIFPLLTRYITKTVVVGGFQNALIEIYKTCALMLMLIGIQTTCNFYLDYNGHIMGARIERDMRAELFEHYQKLSFNFYDNQKTGKLMSRITNDLLWISELCHHGPEDSFRYLVKFIGAFIILLNINLKLTLIVFFFLFLMAIFTVYFNKKMNVSLNKNKESIGNINAQVEDSLSGIRVVKSFANEEIEIKNFSFKNNHFLESRKNTYKTEAYFYNGVSALIGLITVSVVIFGGISILNASLDLSDLITFLLYVVNLIEPIQKLTNMSSLLQEGLTGFSRFMEILNINPDIKDSSNAIELNDIKGNIEFKNVGFKYHEDHDYILDDISLNIKSGEYVAIVGISGAGKTTLCSLIPRFYEVTHGEILLDDINIKDIKLSSLRRKIGVVQQDVYLFSGTVFDNIQYGKPGSSKEEVIEAAKKANAHEFIIKLPYGYDTYIGQRGVKLSGGQKQKLSISRVFLKNPHILIFDEATSNLDNESEKVIQDSLENLAKNRTTFVIAHRLSTIKNAERIIVLTEEGISEQGTHEELISLNGTYANLYNIQSKI